jgi:hypothetical protein
VADLTILSITEGKRPLGRPRPRWDNNTEINIKVKVCDGVGWIDLAQNRDK